MKFTHLVLLKRTPFYIYAGDEQDALKYCDNFKNDLLGIVVAPGGLEVKVPQMRVKLTPAKTELIDLDPTEKDALVDDEDQREILNNIIDSSLSQAVGEVLDEQA